MELNKIFSSKISELRAKRNLKAKDVAKILGVSIAQISLYESGKSLPSVERLYQLAEYYDVSIDYLLGRTHIPDLAPKVECLMEKKDINQKIT
ncbi:helix-turn-helix domain-containing protein [Brevibacillus marinus]|uniref:helix-turn-helix domain-containing protein n=1 Tax=Brevibacillus marinus TaxID=2496837 RepID=UPI0019D083E3|nr:helix-turn-helix transcriptional regulator [Brevibacillus marinus]